MRKSDDEMKDFIEKKIIYWSITEQLLYKIKKFNEAKRIIKNIDENILNS